MTAEEFQDDINSITNGASTMSDLCKSQKLREINNFFELGGEVAKDGNMWGAVIGVMPEQTACGFEYEPVDAIVSCMEEYNKGKK